MHQTAENGSFRRDLRCGEGTNHRCKGTKQLPSADQGAKVTKYVLKTLKIRALGQVEFGKRKVGALILFR